MAAERHPVRAAGQGALKKPVLRRLFDACANLFSSDRATAVLASGFPFVRGRTPLAIAFIDAAAHRQAVPWYQSSPFETMGSYRAQVTRAVPIAHITLEAVLDAILATPADATKRDVIVVGHAQDIGLAMPLASHGRAQSRVEVIRMLAADREAPDGMAAAVSAREVSHFCGLAVPAVETLRAKMNRVRALRLNSVSFRACNIGRWPETLRSYQCFFGCSRVTAPDLRDTYGHVNSEQQTSQLDRWMQHHRRNARFNTWVTGQAPGRLAFSAERVSREAHRYRIAMAHESADALRAWQTRVLGRASSGPFLYHGMFITDVAPGEPSVTFVGERGFASHIVTV